MNFKLLGIPSVLLVSAAFIAGACTIGEISDKGVGGFGGKDGDDDGSGGTSSGGTASGGSPASGGAGGEAGQDIICGPGADLASVEPVAGDDECTLCQKSKCSAEYAECFAEDAEVRAACNFGSTTLSLDGDTLEIEGEYYCMDACIKDEGVADPEAIADCALRCGSECNAETAGDVTKDFLTCLIVGDGAGDDCIDTCYTDL